MPQALTASALAPPSDLFFRTLVECAEDIVTVVEGDGRIVYDSPAVERILGYRQGELVGRNAFELVHADDLGGAFELLVQTARKPGASASLSYRFRHRDGGWRWLASAGRLLPAQPPRLVITSRPLLAEPGHATAVGPEEGSGGDPPSLEAIQMEMLQRLARAAEFRDDDTGQHTRRVGELSAALARLLALPESEAELVLHAAPLHDVGKIGICDAILLKPGPLSREELEVMRTHTVLGARLLSQGRFPLVRTAETIALHHHERWDGAGYPTGLAEEEIPLAARLVSVVDYYDALTHDRPYRRAWPEEEVRWALYGERGARFDPRVTEAFLDMLADDSLRTPAR